MTEETLETNSAATDTSGSTEPTSSSSSADSSTEASQSTTANTAESSTALGSVEADSQVAGNAQASVGSVETANTNPPPEIDYKQRFTDTRKSWEQEKAQREQLQQQAQAFQRELADLKRQFQGIQPQDIEQYRAHQKVPVWDETSPSHQQFLELRRTYDTYERNMRAAPNDETRQWLSQQMSQEIGPEGAKTLREWKQDVSRQEWERQTNPQAFYRKLIQKEAQPVIQQQLQNVSQTYQSVQSAQNEVQKWMKDSAEVATPDNIKSVLGLMEKGETFSVAAARVERDHYRSQFSKLNNAKASVEEKERLLQGNAAGVIARNPNTANKVDFKAVAKERGLVSERDRIDLLMELDQQGRL